MNDILILMNTCKNQYIKDNELLSLYSSLWSSKGNWIS